MNGTTASAPAAKRSFIDQMLDAIGSLYTAAALFTFLFVYSAIGSALIPVRQSRFFEMTEFEWFHWWPFDVVCAALGVAIFVSTLRRVPLTWAKAGTWVAHIGILILLAGSWLYFSTKKEGDFPIIRRQIIAEAPNGARTIFPALPEAQALLHAHGESVVTASGEHGGDYQFSIASIRPDWPILSGDDAGKEAYSVSVRVQPPTGDPFIRQLLAGYPEYTEDILPGKGRAIKNIGKKLVDEELKLSLEYLPATEMFLVDTAALYVRGRGQRDWVERPIHDLPRYNDYIAARGDVWQPEGEAPIKPDPLDLPVNEARGENAGADPLADTEVRVTGYLRYAFPRAKWADGAATAATFNPLIEVRATAPTGESVSHELLAFDPNRWNAEGGLIAFRWHEEGIPPLPEFEAHGSTPHFKIAVPEADYEEEFPIRESVASQGEDLEYTLAGDTGWSWRLRYITEPLALPQGGEVMVSIVDLKDPDGKTITRWVADDASMTRDLPSAALDGFETGNPHGFTPGQEPVEPDTRLVMEFHPGAEAETWLTVRGGPEGLIADELLPDEGRYKRHNVEPGVPFTAGGEGAQSLTVEVAKFFPRAKRELRPSIVPKSQRDRDQRNYLSMIQVEILQGGEVRSVWLPYNHYVFPNTNFRYSGRFGYQSREVRLPNGQSIELMYARERHPLPAPMALDHFEIVTHIGDYEGDNANIRNWVSEVRFAEKDGWSEMEPLAVNEPVKRDGWWMFQSTWDGPQQGSQGLNYTGVGIGNRRGVGLQLLGSIIATLGMIWAFYVKAFIVRRKIKNRNSAKDNKDNKDNKRANSPDEVNAKPGFADIQIDSKTRRNFAVLTALFVVVLSLYTWMRINKSSYDELEYIPDPFVEEVDTMPLANLAVQSDGRLRSLASHAAYYMRFVTGPHEYGGQDPTFTYLDLMFRPEEYQNADFIYVKNKQIRMQLGQTALRVGGEAKARVNPDIMKNGLASPAFLRHPEMLGVLDRLGLDLRRTAKHVNAVKSAIAVSDANFLAERLRIFPPLNTVEDSGEKINPNAHQWRTPGSLNTAPAETLQTGFQPAPDGAISLSDAETQVANIWTNLRAAWRSQNGERVNELIDELVRTLPRPDIYPSEDRLEWESWYFHQKNLTWVWLLYAFSLVPLLLSVVYRWRWAAWSGFGLFMIAFGWHTLAIGIRWYVSGRWPNTNMFEAVTTAAWMGGVLAVPLEVWFRRSAMRSLFALGSAVSSMTALMAVHFLPLQLDPTFSNKMPVLHDIWLYIHTNVIIFSYVLIAMAAVSSVLYVLWRIAGGTADYARAGGTGFLLQNKGGDVLRANRVTPGQIFDGVTMILIELSFVLLFAGIVMGAIWADHSWGRPWGWDPKEVFALNTFFVYLALIHLRIKVRDKGLWTAILSIIGCAVMLFNWIVINFVISGLHSYA